MTKTIRIADDIDDYLQKHGKFGDSHSDVLKKNLKNFGGFMEDKYTKIMKTLDVINSNLKIQEWVTFTGTKTLQSKSVTWRANQILNFTLEDGEPVNWDGENSFSRCNGEKLQVENYIPYLEK